MNKTITVLPGDGIGPEVVDAAVLMLDAVASARGHNFNLQFADIGGIAIDNHGDPFPQGTRKLCLNADAILLGAVGGPKWSGADATMRPEQGLLAIRKCFNLFANLRPVKVHEAVMGRSPLKAEYLRGVDIMVVRELTGGLYFGDKVESKETASDLCVYTSEEVGRVVRVAAELARSRRGKITSVDKANVLATSRLWRSVTSEVLAGEFPDLEVEHLLVDAAAMHLLQRPADFDVIVTENLFGDILTDEASVLAGSIGLLPSASLNGQGVGLYEPIHGSAPDIAGKGIANPYGMIASVAMMFRHSLSMPDEAVLVERAIDDCLSRQLFTADLVEPKKALSTAQVIEALCEFVVRAGTS